MAASSKISKRTKNVQIQCRVNTFWMYMEKNKRHYFQAGVVTLFSYWYLLGFTQVLWICLHLIHIYNLSESLSVVCHVKNKLTTDLGLFCSSQQLTRKLGNDKGSNEKTSV
jgi:hypothetical protein